MPIREIPKAYEYTCDSCGKTHLQENANGHYPNSRPKYWATLHLEQSAYDHQGGAVADASIISLLCDECCKAVVAAINDAIMNKRAQSA